MRYIIQDSNLYKILGKTVNEPCHTQASKNKEDLHTSNFLTFFEINFKHAIKSEFRSKLNVNNSIFSDKVHYF